MADNITFTSRNAFCDGFGVYVLFDDSHGYQLELSRDYLPTGDSGVNPLCQMRVTVKKALVWPSQDGKLPVNAPDCGYSNDKCPASNPFPFHELGLGLGVPSTLFFLVGASIYTWKAVRYFRTRWNWIIEPSEIRVSWPNGDETTGDPDFEQSAVWEGSLNYMLMGGALGALFGIVTLLPEISSTFGLYEKQLVIVRYCYKKSVVRHHRMLREAEWAKRVDDPNVLKFLGATIQLNHVAVVYHGAPRGILVDLISTKPQMDWEVRFSFVADIIHGMTHLYSKWLQCHGRLTSYCIYLDQKFVVKIGDYGLPSFLDLNVVERWFAKKLPGFCTWLLWTPPELLRDYDSPQRNLWLLNRTVDVYSFGIILQELITWSRPYSMFTKFSPKEILEYVRRGQHPEGGPMRPRFAHDVEVSPQLLELTQLCWNEAQRERPDWGHIKTEITKIATKGGARSGGTVVDTLMAQMEELTTNLESTIHELELQAHIDRQRAKEMLYLYIPRKLSDVDRETLNHMADRYEHTTLIVCDLLTPTIIRSQSIPAQVVDCLGKLIRLTEDTMEVCSVTKLYHIHDISMAIAGVPDHNLHHAVDAVRYALRLKRELEDFLIPHKPDFRLKPRIGMSSGPVVGGVLGTQIPRFFVYGEVVNVALRMLSSIGNQTSIQLSSATQDLLVDRKEFVLERRGLVPHREHYIISYWLHGTRESVYHRFSLHDATKTSVVHRPSFVYQE